VISQKVQLVQSKIIQAILPHFSPFENRTHPAASADAERGVLRTGLAVVEDRAHKAGLFSDCVEQVARVARHAAPLHLTDGREAEFYLFQCDKRYTSQLKGMLTYATSWNGEVVPAG
jgi:hypothetical protein